MTRVHELRERWDLIKPRGGLRTLLPTLDRAATIDDLRRLAKLRTPRPVFDYVDGAAEAERSMLRNEGSFADVVFRPHVLRDVSSVDPTWTVLGSPSALPFGFAPTGFTRMMHTDGELAVGRVAASLGIPYGLSTVGTTTPEELAAELPHLRRWFQLYVWRDRGPTRAFVERAREAGFEALILTVDVPVAGARMRDVRNGLTLPPTPSLRTFLQGALHPAWSRDFLTKPPVRFASLETGFEGTAGSFIDRMFDPTVTFDDIEWVRSLWSGKIVVKGVQRIDDAERLAAIGVDAIVVSNHGGRQLDRTLAPLALLPIVRERLDGRVEVWVDGGVRAGSDVVAAIGLGAQFVLVGRAYLYGLMAGGERGVAVAGRILADGVTRTMALLGIRSFDELESDMVAPSREAALAAEAATASTRPRARRSRRIMASPSETNPTPAASD
ncbi:alpha-hydroxy acid oxidase [Acidimicrobium ferrooxidans]|uniref:alpha-hydroxy acid oxidase n=1 Tax=Acidimicrobium ferrooxidans TaxID=53635 RepID=UPI000674622C|nr:alpha-hydroxy acid oxidase [Acidimicrobium ferrooxidans]